LTIGWARHWLPPGAAVRRRVKLHSNVSQRTTSSVPCVLIVVKPSNRQVSKTPSLHLSTSLDLHQFPCLQIRSSATIRRSAFSFIMWRLLCSNTPLLEIDWKNRESADFDRKHSQDPGEPPLVSVVDSPFVPLSGQGSFIKALRHTHIFAGSWLIDMSKRSFHSRARLLA
jgi:hypothetical protein